MERSFNIWLESVSKTIEFKEYMIFELNSIQIIKDAKNSKIGFQKLSVHYLSDFLTNTVSEHKSMNLTRCSGILVLCSTTLF